MRGSVFVGIGVEGSSGTDKEKKKHLSVRGEWNKGLRA